jgi:hypothetical protein
MVNLLAFAQNQRTLLKIRIADQDIRAFDFLPVQRNPALLDQAPGFGF